MSEPEWIHRYEIRGDSHEGWAIIIIDSNGFFATVSDFGNYAFHWTSFNNDFKKFLITLNADYLCGKLSIRPNVYDPTKTESLIKEHILENRRMHILSKGEAKKEWELLLEIDLHHEDGFKEWLERTDIEDGYEMCMTMRDPQCMGFCTRLYPKFVEQLKKELKKI